tara:strand:- start:10998 stop:11258 length:261 start_codon:yes stop_codon:yes gene_type:complete
METQAEREKKMTWQQIRDDSISKLKETYDAVTSGYIEKEIQEERYKICEECSEFIKLLRLCNECKCYMPAKTLFNKSKCPKGYWNK